MGCRRGRLPLGLPVWSGLLHNPALSANVAGGRRSPSLPGYTAALAQGSSPFCRASCCWQRRHGGMAARSPAGAVAGCRRWGVGSAPLAANCCLAGDSEGVIIAGGDCVNLQPAPGGCGGERGGRTPTGAPARGVRRPGDTALSPNPPPRLAVSRIPPWDLGDPLWGQSGTCICRVLMGGGGGGSGAGQAGHGTPHRAQPCGGSPAPAKRRRPPGSAGAGGGQRRAPSTHRPAPGRRGGRGPVRRLGAGGRGRWWDGDAGGGEGMPAARGARLAGAGNFLPRGGGQGMPPFARVPGWRPAARRRPRRVNAVCVLGSSGAGRCVTRGVGVDSF